MSLNPGFSLIANPFVKTGTVGALFKGWPNGTTLNKFDTQLARLVENSVVAGKWTRPEQELSPGEGAIFFNPTEDYKMHNFVGDGTIDRRDVVIHLLAEDRTEVARFNILQAWPCKWVGPALNAKGSGIAIEELELAHETLELE